MESRLLSTHQAAQALGLRPQTLRVWRLKGKGPQYIRYGNFGGRVAYRPSDIEKWLAERTFASTTEETVRELESAEG